MMFPIELEYKKEVRETAKKKKFQTRNKWKCYLNVENKEVLVEEQNWSSKTMVERENKKWKKQIQVILLMISMLMILNTFLFTFWLSVPCVIGLVNVFIKVSTLCSTHLFLLSNLPFSLCVLENQCLAGFSSSTCITFFSLIYDQDLK